MKGGSRLADRDPAGRAFVLSSNPENHPTDQGIARGPSAVARSALPPGIAGGLDNNLSFVVINH